MKTATACGCDDRPVRPPPRRSVRPPPRVLREQARERVAVKKPRDYETVRTGKCRPYVKIERDAEAFAACNALAEELGPLDDPKKIQRVLQEAIGEEIVEVFGVITLDLHCRLVGIHITGRGEESSVMAPIKATCRAAVVDGAHAVIIFHVHPSGVEAEPSDADIETTEAFVEAFDTVDIELIDHVILGGDVKNTSYYSFLENKQI